MPFQFRPLNLPEVILIEPKVFADERGYFMETYRKSDFVRNGIAASLVQSNQSFSTYGTLRGLHFQNEPNPQGKLIRVIRGSIFDVVVDIRIGSPSYGKWIAVNLSEENKRMIYVPPGFAHGACSLSGTAQLFYQVTNEYAPECEAGVIWNDPALGIEWPIAAPKLSSRDCKWPTLAKADNRFVYEAKLL